MKNKKSSHSLFETISYLLKLQWKYVKLSFIYCLLLIPVSLLLSYFNIYIPKAIVSEAISDHSKYQMLINIGIVGIIIIILNLVSQFISTHNTALMMNFRTKISYLNILKSLNTDYENIESSKYLNVMERASRALWGSGNGSIIERMSRGSTELITNILGYILFGSIISLLHPLIAVMLTAFSLINFFLVKSIQKYQYSKRNDLSDLDRKLWYIANNSGNLSGAKDIRIYGMNTWFSNMYKILTKERLSWDKKFALKKYIVNIIDALMILIRDGFAYIILIYLVFHGNIAADDFILYMGAIGSFVGWIGGIINKFNELNELSLYTSDLIDYFDYPDKTNRSICEVKPNIDTPFSIVLDNVCYKYEGADEYTIKNTSIKINPGEKIALVGSNGAGKTSLVKLICGLYNPSIGNILINGYDKNTYNIYDYYSMFSVIFQDCNLLPVSIANIVSSNIDSKTDRKKVQECLMKAGLWDKVASLADGIDSKLDKQINPNAIDLSGGEKQKLLLARALYKDAPILILDEPTASLDPIAENEIYLKYNDLTHNKTSIFISHRLASTRFCDRIIYIDNGVIKELGTHEELMNLNGDYANLFNIQSHFYKDNINEEKMSNV